MLPSRARTTLAAVAAAAVLVTAGCGVDRADDSALKASGGAVTDGTLPGGSKTPAPVEPGSFDGTGGVVRLQQAADATASMDTMSMTMDMQMSGIPMFGDMNITMEGAIDTKGEKAHMTMDMGDMFSAMGSLGGEDMPSDAGVIEMIIDGDTSYMKSSLFEMMPGVDDSKPWFEAPADEVSDSNTFSQGSNDPREFLEFLRNNGSEVTEVGTEDLRGVETTHLRTVLDPEKMIETAAPDEKADMEDSLDELGASGITEIPVDVWIDGDGMVRKMVMTMDMSGIDTGSDDAGFDTSEMSMVITMEMFDFGEPVDIDVPDPSEVQKMPAGMLED
jgi:hypothetical protein